MVTAWKAKVVSDGLTVAACESAFPQDAWNEIMHYAVQYAEDGFSESFKVEMKKVERA